MNKPVLFAYPVNDLTIARYLAAKEIDFIGIDLDLLDEKLMINRIKQFREWIEGPKLIGVTSTPNKSIIDKLGLDGYYLDDDFAVPENLIRFYSIPSKVKEGAYLIIKHPEDAIGNAICLLKTTIHTDISSVKNVHGYLFNPGAEEKIGIYDFDILDDWLETIFSKGV